MTPPCGRQTRSNDRRIRGGVKIPAHPVVFAYLSSASIPPYPYICRRLSLFPGGELRLGRIVVEQSKILSACIWVVGAGMFTANQTRAVEITQGDGRVMLDSTG